MQRSSESIASLAAALAKAQGELINPEKTLTATIRSDGPRGAEQTFRYASLSSGLDIVRKTLGQHEIATVQTTAIDQTAGVVNLTTTLAHSSGEWIASDWPVCAISETATPRRMGAALTYARRYALFTLVGIAGEDDLDAPDLGTPPIQLPEPQKPEPTSNGRLNGSHLHLSQNSTPSRGARVHSKVAEPTLVPEVSAQLRDRLLTELSALACGDDAALWAKQSLPEKNRLTAADAQNVEDAFRTKLAIIATPPAGEAQTPKEDEPPTTAVAPPADKSGKRSRSKSIDKSALPFSEPRRIRNRDHIRYVAKQPCLICGRQPCDAHHLRFTQSRALGRKVSDEFTVPLCRGHHREVHRYGDEAAWWNKASIDPTVNARALWLETRPLPASGKPRVKGGGPSVTVDSNPGAGPARSASTREANYKTKPIVAARPR
jgi:hypothetical protein